MWFAVAIALRQDLDFTKLPTPGQEVAGIYYFCDARRNRLGFIVLAEAC